MNLLKPRPHGYQPETRRYVLPKSNPNSFQVLMTAIRRRLADGRIGRFIRFAADRHILVVGAHGSECEIHPTSAIGNVTINATGGRVVIEEYVLISRGSHLLAATHDYYLSGRDRLRGIPNSGYDITIRKGAFLATNVVVVGPCEIGENAVVASGAVVTKDVPPNTLVAGVPARIIREGLVAGS